MVELVQRSLPTNAEGIGQLTLALLDQHNLDEDHAREVIEFYTRQSSPQKMPAGALHQPASQHQHQQQQQQQQQQQTPPELGSVRVPVRAMLFTQGVNEWQSAANVAKQGGLQDEINREGRKKMMDLVERLKRRPDLATVFDGSEEKLKQFLDAREAELKELQLVLANTLDTGTKSLDVLTRASALARGMGCARVTHCKSGKDRTSMSVTLEQVRACCASPMIANYHQTQRRG